MKTQKTWIKVSLTNQEKANLENHARLNKIKDSQMINKLILSLESSSLNIRNLKKGEAQTAFNVNNDLVKILDKYSKIYNTSRNKILRNLIANLDFIETQEEENQSEASISCDIDFRSREELKIVVKEKSTNSSLLIREIFNQVDLIPIRDRNFKLDSRFGVNVSSRFKKNFSQKATELEISNSKLMQNIVYFILGK